MRSKGIQNKNNRDYKIRNTIMTIITIIEKPKLGKSYIVKSVTMQLRVQNTESRRP